MQKLIWSVERMGHLGGARVSVRLYGFERFRLPTSSQGEKFNSPRTLTSTSLNTSSKSYDPLGARFSRRSPQRGTGPARGTLEKSQQCGKVPFPRLQWRDDRFPGIEGGQTNSPLIHVFKWCSPALTNIIIRSPGHSPPPPQRKRAPASMGLKNTNLMRDGGIPCVRGSADHANNPLDAGPFRIPVNCITFIREEPSSIPLKMSMQFRIQSNQLGNLLIRTSPTKETDIRINRKFFTTSAEGLQYEILNKRNRSSDGRGGMWTIRQILFVPCEFGA
ncbi:hypothetical protein JTE90_013585 [Oedothorax gibbosus]|uniref:Uncharacterized protein n=1 Tax=Oedothorax gibbosus TaxID=931172 RepID=A0AAV6VHG2_9ARAC|nr:hypothetical protein JTE90_013585 [Oedothorax gibbosus]